MTSDDARIEPYVHEESSEALRRGGLWAAGFGFIAGGFAGVLTLLGLVKDLEIGFFFGTTAGVISLLLWWAGKKRWLSGWRRYVVLLSFASLPTTIFVVSAFLYRDGIALYIVGPITYLYGAVIVFTGLVFDKRLTRLAGVVAAVEYLTCALLALPTLKQIQTPYPTLTQELSNPALYALRAMMIVACGLFAGTLASTARRLISRILREEEEKRSIRRIFGQFVSPEVGEKILREQEGTAGERKRVVVLFADIRSFTSWSERTEPEELVRQLNEYFDAMVTAIQKNGGVVDKFIGDAVMAVFGGVLELPNPCESAFAAAAEMQAALAALNEKWRSEGKPELHNGVGLHYGDVLQGTIGSADRKEFTVIGDAVNVAARLESLSKDVGHNVVVSSAVADKLSAESRARLASLGANKLKGKDLAVEVFGLNAA